MKNKKVSNDALWTMLFMSIIFGFNWEDNSDVVTNDLLFADCRNDVND